MTGTKERHSNHEANMKAPMYTLLVGFAIFVFVFAAKEVLVHQAINVNFSLINGFLDIGMIICLMLIYNTVYYAFVVSKKTKAFALTLGFLGAGVFELLSFLMVVYADYNKQINLMQLSSLLGNLNLMALFAVIIWSRTRVTDDSITGDNKLWIILTPVFVTGFFFLLTFGMNLSFQWVESFSWIGPVELTLSFIVCLELVLIMVLSVQQYYGEHNENYVSIISAYILILISILFANFLGQYGQMTLFFANMFQVVGTGVLLKYSYRIYIGNPMKNIQQREEQVYLFAKNIERVIQKKTNEVNEINNRFLTELEYAKNIQQSLLPPNRLVMKNTHFMSEYFPCDRLSGDFYDIYKIDDENIGMYILDVSGHGISAALMTMFCNNYIRSTERLIMRFRGLKPHKNLANFFEEFNKMNFPDEMHMVVFFASYNQITKKLTYCSGGMNCIPFVVSEDGSISYLEESEGFAICNLNGIFTPEYKSAVINLKSGDRVLFYTDGLVDNEKNQVFHQDELEQVFKDSTKMSLRQLNEKLISKIYPQSGKLEDDITYFIMEV